MATVAVETLTLPKLANGRAHESRPRPCSIAGARCSTTARRCETPRYRRDRLLADDRVTGPALIVQHNSTTLVPPGYVATVMAYGDMLVSRERERRAMATAESTPSACR